MNLTKELLEQKFNEFTCKKDLINFLQIDCTKKSGQTINYEILNLIGNFGYTLEDISDINIKQRCKNRLIEEYYKNPKYCPNCGKIIPYEKRNNLACSQSCAITIENKRRGPHTKEMNKKISIGMQKYILNNNVKLYTWNDTVNYKRYKKDILKSTNDKFVNFITYRDAIKQHLLLNPFNIKLDDEFLNKIMICKEHDEICPICGKNIIPWINENGKISKSKTCSLECSKELKRKNGQLTQERLIKNGTHKGWQLRNILSYPEKFWITVLKNNNIDFIPNKPLKHGNSNYFLDFYIEINNRKIDLEIDGKQHKYEERIESDKVRDEFILNNNIEVYRVEWNEINSEKGKQIMKEKIDKFLNFIKLNKS